MKAVAIAALIAVMLLLGFAAREWQCREVYKAANMIACLVWR